MLKKGQGPCGGSLGWTCFFFWDSWVYPVASNSSVCGQMGQVGQVGQLGQTVYRTVDQPRCSGHGS